MKTIGLIGGMSWESTVPYYRIINRTVAERLGGLHSAKVLLYSVDFDEIEVLQRTDRWDEAGRILAEAAVRLEGAGADFLVLCTNTMHKVAPAIEARAGIPLLHIAEATADAILGQGPAEGGPPGNPLHHGAGLLPRPPGRAGAGGARAPGGRPGPGPRGDLPGALPGAGPGAFPCRVPPHPRGSGGAGRRGRHPGLHGDLPAGTARGCSRAPLRHHGDPCPCRGLQALED